MNKTLELVELLSEFNWYVREFREFSLTTNAYYRFGYSIYIEHDEQTPRAEIIQGKMTIFYPARESNKILTFHDVEKFRRAILQQEKLLNFR